MIIVVSEEREESLIPTQIHTDFKWVTPFHFYHNFVSRGRPDLVVFLFTAKKYH